MHTRGTHRYNGGLDMWKDTIVEEVRNAGKKLSEQCKNDIHAFSLILKKGTEKSKKEGWKILSKEKIEKKFEK